MTTAIQRLPLIFLATFAVACSGGNVQNPNSDPDPNNVVVDPDMGDDEDAGDVPGATNNVFEDVPPMTIVKEGVNGVLLHGLVLTPDGPVEDAEVLVLGTDIVCVGDCTEDSAAIDATWVATGGVISPGLIDSHNHLPYNFLPEWEPPGGMLYENRYQWADDPTYETHVEPFANHRVSGSHFCPAAKWGEVRSLIHGTTTVQGQSPNQKCIQYGVRNADHHHELLYDHMRTMIGSPRDVDDEQAENFLDSINTNVEPITRIAVHMQEGYEGNNILTEFESWAGRDERDNRHMGVSLLVDGTTVMIHSMSLTPDQLDEAAAANAKVVWSPSSNIVLYGQTAPIDEILDRGITTGIGPDWTVSGEDNMLDELRYARDYAVQRGIARITPEKLWEMATIDGAEVVGLGGYIGRIEVGYRADITVFSRSEIDPYLSVLRNRSEDIGLVMIDGEAYFGAGELREDLGRNEGCEPMDVCGVEKFVCVKEPSVNDGNETLMDVRGRLVNILEGTGFPPEERYGRGDELLELVACQ